MSRRQEIDTLRHMPNHPRNNNNRRRRLSSNNSRLMGVPRLVACTFRCSLSSISRTETRLQALEEPGMWHHLRRLFRRHFMDRALLLAAILSTHQILRVRRLKMRGEGTTGWTLGRDERRVIVYLHSDPFHFQSCCVPDLQVFFFRVHY